MPKRLRLEALELADRLPPLLAAARQTSATGHGAHGRRRPGPGEAFWQFRPVQPGDSAASVDWRQSARSDRLYARQTEWAAARAAWLWRDGSASMDWRSEPGLPLKSRRADLLILALAALLLRGGERVGALGSGLGPVWGQGALDRFGDAMTRRGESLPRLGPEAPAVLAGDFLDPPEASADLLERLGGRGHLLVVLDPAEIALPYEGRTRFVGLEGEGETTIRRAQDLRPAYSEALARHRDALAAIARARGWSLTLHRTDEPPQIPLLALWRLLSEAPE